MTKLLAIAVFACGCLKTLGPDVGAESSCQDASCTSTADGGVQVGCSNTDSDPATAVSFSTDIAGGIFVTHRCRNCHTGNGDGRVDSGLDLQSYATLRAGGDRSGMAIVIAGRPCDSILYQKVTPAPPFGRRMPRESSRFLSTAEMRKIADWIAEGANDN